MKKFLRRIRGAIGLGITWATAWFGVGVVTGLATLAEGGAAFGSALGYLAVNAAISAVSGFVCGAAFSGVLGLAEGRRRFDEMSLPRFALWGGMAGLVVTGIQVAAFLPMGMPPLGALLVRAGTLTFLGSACAAGTLVLARKSEDRGLLEDSEAVAGVGLSPEEERRLLGEGRLSPN